MTPAKRNALERIAPAKVRVTRAEHDLEIAQADLDSRIRAAAAEGASLAEIADRDGRSRQMIWKVLKRDA